MFKSKYVFMLLFIPLFLLPNKSLSFTPQGHTSNCSSCHWLSVAEANRLMKGTGGTVKKTKKSPVPGLFEVTLEKDGRQITAYIDFMKKHVIPSPIISLETGKSITETAATKQPGSYKKVDINKIAKTNSIVLGNHKGKNKIFVFTDPECPYCKKLHVELRKLVASDSSMTIYIKLFPLQMHPQAYDKARVILGRNSLDLLEKALTGLPLPPPSPMDSRKPVDETINLATSLGINATPTMVLPDGRVIPGYWDAPTIRKFLSGKM